jgi:hypothetical protein
VLLLAGGACSAPKPDQTAFRRSTPSQQLEFQVLMCFQSHDFAAGSHPPIPQALQRNHFDFDKNEVLVIF